MKNFQYAAMEMGDRIRYKKGKLVGRGTAGYMHFVDSKITVCDGDTNDRHELHYKYVELIDEHGNDIVAPIIDMTGREINVGSILVYSIKEGGASGTHGLEIGKVINITAAGGLKIERMIKNGVPTKKTSLWSKENCFVHDTKRALLLPCDDTTLVEWTLREYEGTT